MQTEKSCGAVVFTRQNNEIRYVILRQTNGDYGFPKGHMEPGETERAAALREIREEVGISARILEGFREEIRYPFPNRPDVTKQVVYFLAEYAGQEIVCQQSEVSAAYLLPYEKAWELLTFRETKNILAKADHLLKAKEEIATSLRSSQ